MSSSTALRSETIAASIVAGTALILGHLLNYGGQEYGTVAGKGLVLAAHILLVVTLLGAYVRQARSTGILGCVGGLLATLGTVVVSAVVFVELAGAAGVPVEPVLGNAVTATIATVGSLAFVVGMLAFGGATVRAGVFPAFVGWFLVVGTVVFAVGTVAGALSAPVTLLGAILTGAGFVSLGVVLARTEMTPTRETHLPL